MWKQLWKIWLRKCCVCKSVKDLTGEFFYRNKAKAYWYDSRCKSCSNVWREKYRDVINTKRRGKKYTRVYKSRSNSEITGNIYLVQCWKWYKIWCSKSWCLKDRLVNLQNWNPIKLKLITKIKTSDIYGLEYKLHCKLKDRRGVWEWFELSKDDVDYLINYKE